LDSVVNRIVLDVVEQFLDTDFVINV